MSAHFEVNVDCKTIIYCLQEVQSKVSPNHLTSCPGSTYLTTCDTCGEETWPIVGLLVFDFILRGSEITQFLWKNFEFRVRAIDGLQNSELGTISFMFCVFLYKGK